MTIHSSKTAQITGRDFMQVVVLYQDDVPIKVPPEYIDHVNVFSFDLAIELLENTGINMHAIELKEGKQPFYKPIYSLGLLELKILKIYIETHLKIGFI